MTKEKDLSVDVDRRAQQVVRAVRSKNKAELASILSSLWLDGFCSALDIHSGLDETPQYGGRV